jgi:hypothetical protein
MAVLRRTASKPLVINVMVTGRLQWRNELFISMLASAVKLFQRHAE